MRILLSLFLILSNTAYALQIIDVEPGKTYKAKISISNINTVMMHNKVHLLSLHGTSDTVTFQKDEETGWFVFDKKKTVKEAREYEKIKYDGIKKRGYKILIVWDYELRKDFDILVQKCLDFLIS